MDRGKTILKIINNNPGIRFNEIMRISNIRNGTLSHYVKKLEESKKIELERTPRVTRLYPRDISQSDAHICKYLNMPTQKKVILFLLEKNISSAIEIRKFIKKSPSVVSVNLNALFDGKIVSKKYDIPSNKYYLKNHEKIRNVIKRYYPELLEIPQEEI